MCIGAVEENLYPLKLVPDYLRTREMCERAVEKYPYNQNVFLDNLKIQEMWEGLLKINHTP